MLLRSILFFIFKDKVFPAAACHFYWKTSLQTCNSCTSQKNQSFAV